MTASTGPHDVLFFPAVCLMSPVLENGQNLIGQSNKF